MDEIYIGNDITLGEKKYKKVQNEHWCGTVEACKNCCFFSHYEDGEPCCDGRVYFGDKVYSFGGCNEDGGDWHWEVSE